MKIFFQTSNYTQAVYKLAFGKFGESLFNFSNQLDFDHFGIKDIPIDENLSNKLTRILELTDLALKNNLQDVLVDIDKFFNKNISCDLENIDKKFVRLIKDKEKRECLRNDKKICEISLIKFYEKAKITWDNLPDDFKVFSRFSEEYSKMILDAEIKAKRYKELGCDELYNDIISSTENVKRLMNDTYQGFHRISLKNAAIILSKINGFKLKNNEYADKFIRKYVICINKNIYNPKIYPIRYFSDSITDHIKNLICDLEKIPLFDYYMVMVPSTDNSDENKDIIAVKNKNIIPILLGEKDGKCYFISYWI